MRCLGIDPGKNDTGWALYDSKKGLRASGVLEGIDKVTPFTLAQTHQHLTRLVRLQQPDCVAIERYHAQPGRGTKSSLESINLMIGGLIAYLICKKIPYALVTASTHKRWLSSNYVVGLVKVPVQRGGRKRRSRSRIQKKYDIRTYKEWRHLRTEHEADAANLAKFGVCKAFAAPSSKPRGRKTS
jgi:hypothetical protein